MLWRHKTAIFAKVLAKTRRRIIDPNAGSYGAIDPMVWAQCFTLLKMVPKSGNFAVVNNLRTRVNMLSS